MCIDWFLRLQSNAVRNMSFQLITVIKLKNMIPNLQIAINRFSASLQPCKLVVINICNVRNEIFTMFTSTIFLKNLYVYGVCVCLFVCLCVSVWMCVRVDWCARFVYVGVEIKRKCKTCFESSTALVIYWSRRLAIGFTEHLLADIKSESRRSSFAISRVSSAFKYFSIFANDMRLMFTRFLKWDFGTSLLESWTICDFNWASANSESLSSRVFKSFSRLFSAVSTNILFLTVDNANDMLQLQNSKKNSKRSTNSFLGRRKDIC